MDLPIALKTASEKLVVGYKQAQLKKIAQDLSDRYRNESGAGKVLLSKDIEAAVFFRRCIIWNHRIADASIWA